MLDLLDITKKYDDNLILDHINLHIEDLDWVMISGESGCGKTTLLNIMTGLLTYDEGQVLYDNKVLHFQDFIDLRKNDFSIIFQENNFIKEYTVYQNLLYISSQNHINYSKIDELLNQFNLIDLKYRNINQLSSGQQQKIALIKSLLTTSNIIFLDEPTGNLDDASRIEFMEMLKLINMERTIIMITHNQELFKYANKVILIENNHLKWIKNEDIQHNNTITHLKKYKNLSHLMLLKMAGWNFIYYKKYYFLSIFIFGLTCIGIIFSSSIGNNINNDLRKILIDRDTEYEVIVSSEKILSIDEVIKFAKDTKAKNYDLLLNIISSQIDSLNINEGSCIDDIKKIEFKSTYDIPNANKDIYLSSGLYNKLKKYYSNIDTINLQISVLNDYKTYSTMFWVQNDFNLYIPLYQKEWLNISNFDIYDYKDDVIYLDNAIIKDISDKFNKSGPNSNQQIVEFKLKYSNYKDLLYAVDYLKNNENLITFSIYNDFHQLQQTLKNQFLIFSYSSYILGFIAIIVLIFILLVLDQQKSQQYQLLYKQGICKNHQFFLSLYELTIFVIITILLSILGIYIIMTLFNNYYNIIEFLPRSFIEFASIYNLPINQLEFFNIDICYIFKFLCMIILPITSIAFLLSSIRKMLCYNSK